MDKVIIKIKKETKYSICSCGLSDKLPFCDNNHREYNKENDSSYKSIKIISEKDTNIKIKCSNWLKNE